MTESRSSRSQDTSMDSTRSSRSSSSSRSRSDEDDEEKEEDRHSTSRNGGDGIAAAFELWDLPHEIMFHVLRFVAPPTLRASVCCHQLAVLCKNAKRAILEDTPGGQAVALWDTILQQDYGVLDTSRSTARDGTTRTRRACKRLRRTPVQKVRDAHALIKDNTEIAFFHLAELAAAKRGKDCLTKAKMCRILDEYGPLLRLNQTVSSGSLFLVEVCRSRNVKEATILKCVKELVENRGVTMIDMKSNESPSSSQTALCVAAVRGMATVVRYLLQKARASTRILSSGRFRLNAQPTKSLRCTDATPLEFATSMRDAEQAAGAGDLSNLTKCIQLLTTTTTTTSATTS